MTRRFANTLRLFGGDQRLLDCAHIGPDQRVAPTQVVVEKAQGRAHGKGVEPEAELSQFHRHRVEIDAINTALHDQAGQQRRIIKPQGCHHNALLCHFIKNLAPHPFDQRLERIPAPGHVGVLVVVALHLFDDAIGDIVDGVDQEVAGAHRRVTDFDAQKGFTGGAFGPRQFLAQQFDRAAVVGAFELVAQRGNPIHRRGKVAPPFRQHRLQRLLDDIVDNVVRGVVGAGGLALALIVDQGHLAGHCINHAQLIFQ